MDLNELVYSRLAECERLVVLLARYYDGPAIFNTEFPSDQSEGWHGEDQYPRILYRISMQANQERSSSGTIRITIYGRKDPAAIEEIEDLVKGRLTNVLIKPDDEAPFSVAWYNTEPFSVEGMAVYGKDIVFDLIEYPDQFLADPDPVECLSRTLKETFEDAFVIRIDDIDRFRVATEDEPVIYCRMESIDNDHVSYALTWINCRIAIHVIAPTSDARARWVRLIINSLMLSGEGILSDGTPLRYTGMKARNTSDYLTAGQIMLTGQYTLPRNIFPDSDLLRNAYTKEVWNGKERD